MYSCEPLYLKSYPLFNIILFLPKKNMEKFDIDKFDRIASLKEARHQQRVAELMELTDAQVEALNETDESSIQEDHIFKQMSRRPESFFALTGFHLREFDDLFRIVEMPLTPIGRGRRSPLSPRDIFSLILYYLRRYPRYEEAAALFSLRVSTIQNIIKNNIEKIHDVLKKCLINDLALHQLPVSQDFPECGYVVDATVQTIDRPCLSYEKAAGYFSGKHSKYCLKSQVIVTRNGLAVHIVSGKKGAKHDKLVFDKSLESFQNEVISHHPNESKKILADKGYQDNASEILVTPIKGKPLALTSAQNAYNDKLSKARIIIENFFGRLKKRYQIMFDQFRGTKKDYRIVFEICCALINYEVFECGHAFREEDNAFYKRVKAAMILESQQIEKEKKKKRLAQAQARKAKYATTNDE